jgi:site-specific DNA-methyltransferase (adenine-specific)
MSSVVVVGNCLELLANIPDGSFPLVVTDPPYFTPPAQFVSGRSHHQRSLSNLSLLDHFYKDFFGELVPKIRDDGSIYIFCDAQSYPLYYAYLYEKVKAIRLLVWDRGSAINGYTWRYRCQYILFAQMPNAPAVKTGDSDLLVCPSVPVAKRRHPAEKPVPLLERLICKSSQPGDLVLDTFAGSGSTGVAAIQTGRLFLGFELNPKIATDANVAISKLSRSDTSHRPPGVRAGRSVQP